MPVSKGQKTVACMALAMAEGKLPESYSKQAAQMKKSMSKEKLDEWCHANVQKE